MKKRLREPVSGLTHLAGVLLALAGVGVLLDGAAAEGRVDEFAGTYTPICVLALEGGWSAGLLGLVWALAFCGVVIKALWLDAPRWLSVGLYLAMGWVAVVAASAIFKAVPPGGLAWILGDGLVYSAGALIYGLQRPNLIPGVFGFHELWHLFVLAGSACHFWAMLQYIAPL